MIDSISFLNSSIGYVFINLSHSLDGKPLLGASADLVSVRRGPGDCLGFVLPPTLIRVGAALSQEHLYDSFAGRVGGKFLVRQGIDNLWTLRDPQPLDSSIYLYLTLEVGPTYDNKLSNPIDILQESIYRSCLSKATVTVAAHTTDVTEVAHVLEPGQVVEVT